VVGDVGPICAGEDHDLVVAGCEVLGDAAAE
jgi:hypothetical protein